MKERLDAALSALISESWVDGKMVAVAAELYFVVLLLLEFNRPSEKLQEQIDSEERYRLESEMKVL